MPGCCSPRPVATLTLARGSCLRGGVVVLLVVARAETYVFRVGEEVDHLAGRDAALRLLPELGAQQVGVVPQERLPHAFVAEQERLEFLREDVVGADRVPDVIRE